MRWLLFSILSLGCAEPPDVAPANGDPSCRVGVEPGLCAPEFRLANQDGEIVALSEHLGRVVVVESATMWCGVCRTFAHGLDELQVAWGPDELVVLTVLLENNVRELPTVDNAAGWAHHFQLGYDVLADEQGTFRPVWNPRVRVPWSVVVDRDGTVTWSHAGGGAGSEEALSAVIDDLIDP